MDILLHSCCAPCTIIPVQTLSAEGYKTTAYFNNPNIHPFREFKRRLQTLQEYAGSISLPLLVNDRYGLRNFLDRVNFRGTDRCADCYFIRLEQTVLVAKQRGFAGFSSTLLYSKYQKHEKIIEICNHLAQLYRISFIYFDFRTGWENGIKLSKELEMYRQPYCGCIFSEQERYDKKLEKIK
jgi:predicted adenine nucleotide alpha hydrolase (AANH) superfamily ATPase